MTDTSPTPADRPAEGLLGPMTPIRCTEPGCHWACHGVPDKYADSRARIVREHVAAEHAPTPEPGPVPAWVDGDPLMEAMAAAVYEQCDKHPEVSVTIDDPRTIAAVAATVARQLLGTSEAEGDRRCVCGDPIEWMTHPGGPGWIHSPGADTRCLDARPAAAPPAPADRAAVLREAADECDKAGGIYASRSQNEHAGAAFALMDTFRRQADEAEYVATPCSVGACEPGGEPCTTHERLMAHAEGDHELCDHEADRAAIGIRGLLEHVGINLTGRDITVAGEVVDRAPLRDRIRRAICEAEGFAWDTDMLEPDEYGEVADAVLAVLADDAAAGVQPPTTGEAHPPSVEYIAEVLELDGAWEYLGAHADPAVAARRRASVTRRYPDAETRTVRKTTTYTVEPEPAAPAAPEEPQ
ncbi:hypothetical protein [Streptomyces sp. A-14]|uniref:hypothetical protein n=1 Tax=Streptomyces sp. A-14 TaxID=3127467 RepID=UPI003EBB8127